MHAGKVFPFQPQRFVVPGNDYRSAGPTRKMVLEQVGLVATGTVSALWLGTRTISELRQDSTRGPLWSMFEFINGTDPTATMQIHTRFEEVPGAETAGEKYWWHVFYEAYDAGTLIAYRETFIGQFRYWSTINGDSLVGPDWLGVVDPALWFQNRFRSGAANWADQPEYHPYRH